MESYKKEIYQIYMKENNTLQTTMSTMEEKNKFIATFPTEKRENGMYHQ